MSARSIIPTLIVDYLMRVDADRTVRRIILYMLRMHKINPSATRTHLSRLVHDGRIERIARGRYQANHR